MVVITGTDRLGHFLWHIYEEEKHKYHKRILEYFKEIDLFIGTIFKNLKKNDTLIVLSDHGMEKLEKNVHLNTYLEKQGVLYLSEEKLKRYNRIQKGTKAFILDPGRIYLNKKGNFPNGEVSKKEEKDIIDELKILFNDLKFENKKVIKRIFEKKDIYSGNMYQNAPDLVLLENKGFNLKGSIGKKEIFEDEKTFSGKHNENSFILINKDIDIEKPTAKV